MSAPKPTPEPSTNRWLAATLGTVVLCLGALAYNAIDTELKPTGDEPPKTQLPAIVRRAVADEPDPPIVPYEFPALPQTPAEREKARQEFVHQQARYFRELAAKHPKTASLATPEQIDQMEKEGRVAR